MNYIRLIAILIACNMAANTYAAMATQDSSQPGGWGSVNGEITGSSDENPVTVTTAKEFSDALKMEGQKTIYVKGTLTFSKQLSIKDAQDKTIYGLPGSVLANPYESANKDSTGVLLLKNCKNIILRNLTFQSAGAYDIDGRDNLTLQNSQNIWVDHCDFQDGVDGNLDCNNGTDFVTITWCRFHYLIAPRAGGSGGSADHRFSNLIGGSDKNASEDEGHLRITYAYCWWDEGCRDRMPRIRFGQVHVANCLFSSSVAGYCVGAGYRCNAYVEKCVFVNQKNPWKSCISGDTYTDYNITMTDCIGADDSQSRSGDIEYFNPYTVTGYSLKTIAKGEVEATVKNGSGAVLNIKEGEKYTTSIHLAMTDTESSATYYSLSGVKRCQPAQGVNIAVVRDQEGKSTTRKFFK